MSRFDVEYTGGKYFALNLELLDQNIILLVPRLCYYLMLRRPLASGRKTLWHQIMSEKGLRADRTAKAIAKEVLVDGKSAYVRNFMMSHLSRSMYIRHLRFAYSTLHLA